MLTPSILLNTACETAVLAGELARQRWSRPLRVRAKGFRDLVTDADLAVQKLITDTISASFPDHGFLTEETDATLPAAGPIVWIIDPIDGTTNYSRQNPIFCVSIAAAAPVDREQWAVGSEQLAVNSDQWAVGSGSMELVAGYRVLAGAVYDPLQDELFSAAAGEGARLGSRHGQQPLQVSAVNEMAESVISLDWSHGHQKRQSSLDVLHYFGSAVHSIRALGSAALAIAWIGAGRLDGYLNYSLQPWDVAAAGLILQEAGGTISNSVGHPLGQGVRAGSCVATNGHIHRAFLQRLRGEQ